MSSIISTVTVGVLAFSVPLFSAPGSTSPAVSLDQQLRSLYPPVELSSDRLSVTRPGTVLQVNKAKIGMLQNIIPFANTYRDGQIKQALVSRLMVPNGTDADVHVGDKVYLDNIEVKPKGKAPSITFSIQACGNCDFSPISTGLWRANVSFPFAEGAFDQPDLARIRQVIGEVFSVVQPAPAVQSAPDAQQISADPQQSVGAPAPAPVNIQLGQSPGQVMSMLGQPERKATVGAKEIYFYKDMKITFQNGAVSDVQ